MAEVCVFCQSEIGSSGVCERKGCRLYGIYKPGEVGTKTSDFEKYANLDEPTKQIVLAQNRTTHAVRALVRFIFIQLTSITLAAISFAISVLNPDGGLAIFAVVGVSIYVIGIIWSSRAGWDELEKSNIPNR